MPGRCSRCPGPRQSGSRQPEVKRGSHTPPSGEVQLGGGLPSPHPGVCCSGKCFSFSEGFETSLAPLQLACNYILVERPQQRPGS